MRLLAPVAASWMLLAGSANAASLFVRPTTVIIPPGNSAATVTVSNSGTTPITAQLRMFGWDQPENEDQLTATAAVAASPPMITIAPGQSQTVRLVRTTKGAVTREESYRLYVDEIVDRKAASGTAGIQIQLRYSIPVFALVNTSDAASLSTTASIAGGAVSLEARNAGKAHAQISAVTVLYADGSTRALVPGLAGYVLPDRTRRWSWVLPVATQQPRQLKAVVNGQEIRLDL